MIRPVIEDVAKNVGAWTTPLIVSSTLIWVRRVRMGLNAAGEAVRVACWNTGKTTLTTALSAPGDWVMTRLPPTRLADSTRRSSRHSTWGLKVGRTARTAADFEGRARTPGRNSNMDA